MKDLIRQNLGKSASKSVLDTPRTWAYLVLGAIAVLLSDSDSGGSIAADAFALGNEDVARGQDCSISGFAGNPHRRLSYHEDKLGQIRCCATITCPQGTEARLCDDSDPESTSCVDCEPGTRQSSQFESYYSSSFQCEIHTECIKDGRVLWKGNSTADTVCECNFELGFYGTWPHCHQDKPCPPGYQLLLNGSCEHCPQNFHRPDSAERCIQCSECDRATQTVESNCTSTQDTICSSFTMTGFKDNDDGDQTIKILLVSISVVAVFAIIVVVVLSAIICHKCLNRKRSNEGVGTSSSSSISCDSPPQVAEKKTLISPKDEIIVTDIYNRDRISLSRPSLCVENDAKGKTSPTDLHSDALVDLRSDDT